MEELLQELKQLNSKDERLSQFITDSTELLEHNEIGIGLELLLTNLYEFTININSKSILLIKEIMTEIQMNWEDWKFIETLKTNNL